MRCLIVTLALLSLGGLARSEAGQGGDREPALRLTDLRCEYLENPLGIDVARPRLSWKLAAVDPGERGLRQSAYRVLVASSPALLALDEGDLWDSGRVGSSRSVHVEWEGVPLRSRMACCWKVRAWDGDGEPSDWSEVARWSMGLLDPSDWSARWIGAARPEGEGHAPDPWLRRSFELSAPGAEAFAWVASLGYHELYVNGAKVGESVLTPSISDLSQRVRYATYDIREHLRPGRNAIALWLGGGWAHFPTFGCEDGPLVMARVEIGAGDGTITSLVTDADWKVRDSNRTLLGEWRFGRFGGERVDAGAALPGWADPDLDDSAWAPATLHEPEVRLSAERIEPNVLVEAIRPRGIEELEGEPGVWRIDMGRSFTGWTEIRLRGDPGATATLSFAEREDQECTYAQRSELVLDGRGEGIFRHRFNYATGRWITVRGAVEEPRPEDVRGWLVRSGYRRASSFACSGPLLNRIHDAVLWTYQCLSLGGYVVDCPHRERQGYGGDAHATMETALSSFEQGAFHTKWMQDWRDVQGEDGNIPYTAPTYEGGGGPAWSGVCIALPWEVWLACGDTRILEENYGMMGRWLAFLETRCEDGILRRYGHENWGFLGDWVPPGRQQGRDGRVDERSTLFFNNCYRFWTVRRMARIAELLGRAEDAARYGEQAEAIRRIVHEEFYDPETATYANGEQPYLAFPLLAGLTPPELVPAVMAELEREILVEKSGHVDSGIHGTYFLLKHLAEAGRHDLIHEMVSKTDYPSWGHMLEQGATTIWEQWDGVHSLCHSSFLSVGAWFTRGVVGIRPDPLHPGYEHFFVAPALVGDLSWAKASFDSIRGPIASSWEVRGDAVILKVEVPPNTRATVSVPADDAGGVTEGGGPAGEAEGVRFLRAEAGAAVYEVGSGSYAFASEVSGLRGR